MDRANEDVCGVASYITGEIVVVDGGHMTLNYTVAIGSLA
jgi:hypothetical protein